VTGFRELLAKKNKKSFNIGEKHAFVLAPGMAFWC